MKYHILYDFVTFTPLEEKFSDHFEDLHKLKLLTKFVVNLTSSPGEVIKAVINYVLNI